MNWLATHLISGIVILLYKSGLITHVHDNQQKGTIAGNSKSLGSK